MPENNERLAILEKAYEGIEKGMSRMEQKLDSLLEHIEKKFVPRSEMEATNRRLEDKIEALESHVKAIRERDWKLVGWTITTIATIGASVLLIIFK